MRPPEYKGRVPTIEDFLRPLQEDEVMRAANHLDHLMKPGSGGQSGLHERALQVANRIRMEMTRSSPNKNKLLLDAHKEMIIGTALGNIIYEQAMKALNENGGTIYRARQAARAAHEQAMELLPLMEGGDKSREGHWGWGAGQISLLLQAIRSICLETNPEEARGRYDRMIEETLKHLDTLPPHGPPEGLPLLPGSAQLSGWARSMCTGPVTPPPPQGFIDRLRRWNNNRIRAQQERNDLELLQLYGQLPTPWPHGSPEHLSDLRMHHAEQLEIKRQEKLAQEEIKRRERQTRDEERRAQREEDDRRREERRLEDERREEDRRRHERR